MAIQAERQVSRLNPYGHLPTGEHPLPGQPRVDVLDGLFEHKEHHEMLDDTIRQKRLRTMREVAAHQDGYVPSFLTRPVVHRSFPDGARQTFADMMAELIRNVYGDGYPLPNKDGNFNLKGIDSGTLLPYLAVTGPQEVLGSNGRVYEEPDILSHPDVKAMAASGIIVGDKGFAELGRFARRQETPYVDGGAIILEMVYDWMRNRLGLLEGIHTLYADMRGAAAHDHSPHSGNVQKLLLGHSGMKIISSAPMYDVNGIEPMLKVALFRDPEKVRQYNEGKTIHVPAGSNVELLKALWENQLGVSPNVVVEEVIGDKFEKAHVEYHGEHIYTGIHIDDSHQQEENPSLDEVLAALPTDAPAFFVQVDAESEKSAATQKALMDAGFVHCGIMPGQKSEFLVDAGDRSKGVREFVAPATIFMVKLGNPIVTGKKPLAPAYYPTPADAGGVDLHGGDHIRALLYANDAVIRSAIHA